MRCGGITARHLGRAIARVAATQIRVEQDTFAAVLLRRGQREEGSEEGSGTHHYTRVTGAYSSTARTLALCSVLVISGPTSSFP